MFSNIDKYIPTFQTPDTGWIRFHKQLDSTFSRAEANKYWKQAWSNTGGVENYKANTSVLREHMKKKGVDIAAPTTWQSITDAGGDISSVIRGYVWVAIIIVATGLALKFFVFNKPKSN